MIDFNFIVTEVLSEDNFIGKDGVPADPSGKIKYPGTTREEAKKGVISVNDISTPTKIVTLIAEQIKKLYGRDAYKDEFVINACRATEGGRPYMSDEELNNNTKYFPIYDTAYRALYNISATNRFVAFKSFFQAREHIVFIDESELVEDINRFLGLHNIAEYTDYASPRLEHFKKENKWTTNIKKGGESLMGAVNKLGGSIRTV
jgi:hypothetical protein